MEKFNVESNYDYGETWLKIQSRKIGVVYLRGVDWGDVYYIIDQLTMGE